MTTESTVQKRKALGRMSSSVWSIQKAIVDMMERPVILIIPMFISLSGEILAVSSNKHRALGMKQNVWEIQILLWFEVSPWWDSPHILRSGLCFGKTPPSDSPERPPCLDMPPQAHRYIHRKAKEVGSSTPRPLPHSRTMRNIVHTAQQFQEHILAEIKSKIKEVEDEALFTREFIPDEEIRKDYEALLPNPDYSRGRSALYMKTLEIAWQQKFILGKILVDRGEDHSVIILQLDEITWHLQQIASHLGIK